MKRHLVRGGVTLYMLMLAVTGVAGLSFVLLQASQVYSQQQRNEHLLRARLAAEAAIAMEDSATHSSRVAAVGSYATTYNGVGINVTSTVTNPGRSAANGERVTARAQYRESSVVVGLETGKRRAANFTQWHFASRVMASDRTGLPTSTLHQALGAPNFDGPKVLSSMPHASATFTDFSIPLESGSQHVWLIPTSYGSPLVTPYDVMLTMVDSAPPDLANMIVEVQRGSTRTRITNLAAQGANVQVLSWSGTTYCNTWKLGPLPHADGASYRVVFIDLDPYTNGTIVKNGTGDLQVTLSFPTPNTTAVPTIDSVAFLGPPTPSTGTGVLAEYSSTWSNGYWPWANLWDPSVPDEVYLRRIDHTFDVTMGSNNTSHAVGSTSQYWFITYSSIWTAPQSGTYTFTSNGWADNGYWLWVNDQLVYNSQTGFNPGISLTAGQQVRLWIEIFDGGGWFGVQPRYRANGGTPTAFPAAQMRPGLGHQLVYANSFDVGTPAGWTWNGIRTVAGGGDPVSPPVNGILSFNQGRSKTGATTVIRALGDFGGTGNWANLNLGSVPAGRMVMFFDVIMHATWDSNNGSGPDQFVVRANSNPLLNLTLTDFASNDSNSPTVNWRIRGNSWGMGGNRSYRTLRVEWSHGGGPLELRFSSEGANIQGIDDESWSLDNVVVRRKRESVFE